MGLVVVGGVGRVGGEGPEYENSLTAVGDGGAGLTPWRSQNGLRLILSNFWTPSSPVYNTTGRAKILGLTPRNGTWGRIYHQVPLTMTSLWRHSVLLKFEFLWLWYLNFMSDFLPSLQSVFNYLLSRNSILFLLWMVCALKLKTESPLMNFILLSSKMYWNLKLSISGLMST